MIGEDNRPRMTIAELTHQCNDAAAKMSAKNPHKRVFLNCATALQQLVQRLAEAEKGQVQE